MRMISNKINTAKYCKCAYAIKMKVTIIDQRHFNSFPAFLLHITFSYKQKQCSLLKVRRLQLKSDIMEGEIKKKRKSVLFAQQ